MVRVMAKRRVKFTFPQDLVTQPLIYNLGRNFEIITNIRRADIRDNMGWMLLELEGDEDELDRAIEWMVQTGVRVDPITGDLIEG